MLFLPSSLPVVRLAFVLSFGNARPSGVHYSKTLLFHCSIDAPSSCSVLPSVGIAALSSREAEGRANAAVSEKVGSSLELLLLACMNLPPLRRCTEKGVLRQSHFTLPFPPHPSSTRLPLSPSLPPPPHSLRLSGGAQTAPAPIQDGAAPRVRDGRLPGLCGHLPDNAGLR